MKKFRSLLSLILLLGFLSSTTGINVYKHYCGNFLADVSFFIKNNPCADESGEDTCSAEKEMDCCEDETEFYQLDTKLIKHQANSDELVAKSFKLQSDDCSKIVIELVEAVGVQEFFPPPKFKNPLYQQFQQLVFYG